MSRPLPIPPTCFFPDPSDVYYYRPDQQDEHGVTDVKRFAENWQLTDVQAVKRVALGQKSFYHSWYAVPQEKCHVCHPELPNTLRFPTTRPERQITYNAAAEIMVDRLFQSAAERSPELREEGGKEKWIREMSEFLEGWQRQQNEPRLEDED